MNKDVLEQMQKELSRLTKLSEQKEEIIQQVSSIEGLDERVIEVIKSQEKKNQELFPSEKFQDKDSAEIVGRLIRLESINPKEISGSSFFMSDEEVTKIS
jgi:uncharacterized membrane protein YqiK